MAGGTEPLRRELGTLDVVALGLNGVIGTGIFFLPGQVAALLGPASLLSFGLSALLCLLLVLCFAEVGSRFVGTGGPMLYAAELGGPRAGAALGFTVGWITWVVRLTSWAALANGFVHALAPFWDGAEALRVPILGTLFVALAAVNIAGVRHGSRITVLFTAAKLVPLLVFAAVGLAFLEPARFTPFAPRGLADLGRGTMLLLYAFVGFEVLAVPAGEMKDPSRSVPRALLITIGLVAVVYLAVWAVCTGTHPQLAGVENAVAESAAHFLGPLGGGLIAGGILLSVFGINAGSALVAPRCLFALAQAGDLPRPLAAVWRRTGAPVPAIVVSTAVALFLAVQGSFVELAVISVVGRFAQYVPTCLAVPLLRRRADLPPPTFRVPGGPAIPLIAMALLGWLLIETEPRRLLWGLVGLVSGWPLFALSRWRRR